MIRWLITSQKYLPVLAAALLVVVGPCAVESHAGAVRNLAGFTTNVLPPNDDGSTGSVPIGFSVNFYGLTFSDLFVNNNGNITFDAPLATYTPFGLTNTAHQIIAPFFADVDTRSAGSPVTFGNDTVDAHTAFGVDWINVDYYG